MGPVMQKPGMFLTWLDYRRAMYAELEAVLIMSGLLVAGDFLLNVQDFASEIRAGIDISGYFFESVYDS